jgi:dienelactone hydrolase
MNRALLITAVVIALAVFVLSLTSVRALLVASTLPEYPDWPTPQPTLSATDSGRIYFPTSSPYDLEVMLADISRAPGTTGLGFLSYPERASSETPVPAMVILPGSGGIAPGREHDYAAWFNEHGIAAFVVEYYKPRGFDKSSNYMIRTSAVTEFDLIADAYSAMKLLGSSPLIDATRIGVIGFSYGGMAARLAMDQRIRNAIAADLPPFALHIDAYGPCFQILQSPGLTGGPLLTLRGTKDASNDLAACEQRERELRELGSDVTAHVYEGVGHSWEVEQKRFFSENSPYLSGCEVIYDDGGRPFLDGEPLNDYDIDASLATRVAARFSSNLRFKDCVGYGYIIGRDEEARRQAYADILSFLRSQWPIQPPGEIPAD